MQEHVANVSLWPAAQGQIDISLLPQSFTLVATIPSASLFDTLKRLGSAAFTRLHMSFTVRPQRLLRQTSSSATARAQF